MICSASPLLCGGPGQTYPTGQRGGGRSGGKPEPAVSKRDGRSDGTMERRAADTQGFPISGTENWAVLSVFRLPPKMVPPVVARP
jgi:hypothetical protein